MSASRIQEVTGVSWDSTTASPTSQPDIGPSIDSKGRFFLPYLIIIAKAKTGLVNNFGDGVAIQERRENRGLCVYIIFNV